ncbi:MAG: hypothetical protein K2M44_01500 [Clostridia bacterium]|nr:hypothetical protein [Clostridia bacterium]
MRKRSVLIVVLLLVVAITAVLCLGACESVNPEYGQTDPFQELGAPNANPAMRLNYTSSMTAADLLEIGFYNYYKADYVVSVNYGYNATVGGGMDMNGQYIDGYKIRKGVYDDTQPLSADCYHLSRSGGLAQKTWEEGLITGGTIKHRITDSSNISFSNESQMIRIENTSNFRNTDYGTNLYDYNDTVCNDPTKILMYDIFDTSKMELIRNSIKQEGEVAHDAQKGVYSFKVEFDPKESTIDYIRVIEANLKKTSNGARINEFTKLSLDVEMWESGLIKKISISEQYKFVMMLSLTNDYWANVYFGWDEDRTGYVMSDYTDAFTSNVAIERNNAAYDEAGGRKSISLVGKIVAIVVPILVVVIAAIVVGVYFGVKRKKSKATAGESSSVAEGISDTAQPTGEDMSGDDKASDSISDVSSDNETSDLEQSDISDSEEK